MKKLFINEPWQTSCVSHYQSLIPGTVTLYCSSSTKKILEDERYYFELKLNYCVRLIIIYLVSLICFTECVRGQNLCYKAF